MNTSPRQLTFRAFRRGPAGALSGFTAVGKVNIMNGKPPAAPMMDRNGDGFYNSPDSGVARTALGQGTTAIIKGPQVSTIFVGGGKGGSGGGKINLRRPILAAVRPGWRQMQ